MPPTHGTCQVCNRADLQVTKDGHPYKHDRTRVVARKHGRTIKKTDTCPGSSRETVEHRAARLKAAGWRYMESIHG